MNPFITDLSRSNILCKRRKLYKGNLIRLNSKTFCPTIEWGVRMSSIASRAARLGEGKSKCTMQPASDAESAGPCCSRRPLGSRARGCHGHQGRRLPLLQRRFESAGSGCRQCLPAKVPMRRSPWRNVLQQQTRKQERAQGWRGMARCSCTVCRRGSKRRDGAELAGGQRRQRSNSSQHKPKS